MKSILEIVDRMADSKTVRVSTGREVKAAAKLCLQTLNFHMKPQGDLAFVVFVDSALRVSGCRVNDGRLTESQLEALAK